MHEQPQLNGRNAFPPSASLGTGGRRSASPATSPTVLARHADRTASARVRDEIQAHAQHAFAANGFGDANVGTTAEHPHRSNAGSDQGAPAQRASRFMQSARATLQKVGDVARRLYASWKRRRLARATCVALHELDTRTLRDLGFDRSEIGSIAAEVAGDIDSTPARLVQARHGLPL